MLQTINPKLLAWLWLLLAIITEVLGSSFLKLAQSMSYGFLVTAFFICVSYYFIGLAIKQISVSVAYAMWEVLGVICIVLIGIWYFDENLAAVQYAGIACAVVGILLINFGEVDSGDSALGSHSSDFVDFGTTADHKSSSAPKSTKSTASTTAIPRILEEDKEAGRESSTILESQSSFTKQTENLESTFEKQAECEKVDSSPALQGLYAIGGISLETLPALANMPISGVCMRQALMHCKNPAHYVRVLREKVEIWRLQTI